MRLSFYWGCLSRRIHHRTTWFWETFQRRDMTGIDIGNIGQSYSRPRKTIAQLRPRKDVSFPKHSNHSINQDLSQIQAGGAGFDVKEA